MNDQKNPDKLARVGAGLSAVLASVGLYLTWHTSQREDRAEHKVAAQESLQKQGVDFLRQLARRYDYVDDSSISQHIAAVLPLYRDPLEHFYDLEQLDHDGLAASLQTDLKRYRSFQNLYTDVVVEATDDHRYRITAIGTSDRTYVAGQQPTVCQDKTRSIQDVDLVLDVEVDPTKGWLVVFEDDTPRTLIECH
jgi:hypothetical protein